MDIKTLIILLFSLVISSCESNTKKMKDEFYTTHTSGDLIRIPLIKPLELVSPDEGDSWFFKPKFGQIDKNNLEIDNVSKFGIVDSVIIVYSERIYINSQMGEVWFVTDLKNKTEIAFTSNKEYIKHLNSININLNRLHNCNETFMKFRENGELPFKGN